MTTMPATIEIPDPPAPVKGSHRRLLYWVGPANFSWVVVWGVFGILMPLQVQGIDPANKVANLAVVSTVGGITAMLAQPLAGAVSDRTRSRFGRRAPWMIVGALVGGLALVSMAFASTIGQIVATAVAMQIAFNFVQGPLGTILPDRVPQSLRGRFSAIAGMGVMAGSIIGSVFAASFASNIPAGYLAVAGFTIVVIVLFVVFNPDHSSRNLPLEPFSLLRFLKSFWINPIANPDFFWAFTGRFLLYLGFYVVTGYQLYILQDYVHLGAHAVDTLAILNIISLVGLVISLVVSGPLSDKLRRRKIFVFLSSITIGLAFLIPIFSPTVPAMYAMYFIAGLGFGMFQTVDGALMSEVLPSAASYGKDTGIVNVAVALPQALAPAIASLIVLSIGYIWLFPIGMLLCVIGAIAVWRIRQVR